METSIFTRIINGEIPCERVYEDEKTIAFLDIHPDKPGHTLVVTKVQVDQFTDLPDEDYAALWQTVKKVSIRLKEVLQKDRVKVLVHGIDVPHTHVHLIPFNVDQDTPNLHRSEVEPDHTALAEMAEKLAF